MKLIDILREAFDYVKEDANLSKYIAQYNISSKYVTASDEKIVIDFDKPDDERKQLANDILSGSFTCKNLISASVEKMQHVNNIIEISIANLIIHNPPSFLFYFTPKENSDAIIANGISLTTGIWKPKGNWAAGKVRYNATFLFANPNKISNETGVRKFSRKSMDLFKVDTSGLRLYKDPNNFSYGNDSFITFDDIPVAKISRS